MKHVLVTPLDWGLGHATRCIPIVRELLANDHKVVMGGYGPSLELLRKEFPQLEALTLPGYRPTYPATGSMVWKMASQLPKFASAIRHEHEIACKLVKDRRFDIIISDNRYGCWSPEATSVLITHQSNVLMPKRFGWAAPAVRKLVLDRITRFDFCWIPDFPDKRFSGALTDFAEGDAVKNVRFIGPISRFQPGGTHPTLFDVVAILSGPEPQRSLFENLLLPQLQQSGLRHFIVRGLPQGDRCPTAAMADFMKSHDLQRLIESADVIICRSGYSSVMDMAVIGKKAIFVPTPGQTEQEYLAAELKRTGIAYSMSQRDFDLRVALAESRKYSGFVAFPAANDLLKKAIGALFK